MKLFWLTPGQLGSAVILGLVIAVFVTFLTAPQPVEVPVQVITPVPTPPPVVITEHPAPQQPAPASGGSGNPWNATYPNPAVGVWNLLGILPLIVAVGVILGVVAMLGFGRD